MAAPMHTAAARARVALRRPFFGWYVVGAALVAQALTAGVSGYVVGVFMVPMTEDLGWTRSEFAYAQVLGPLGMGVLGFWLGGWVDRYGGRRFMFAGTTLMALALALTSAVHEVWQWVLLRGLLFTVGGALTGQLVINTTVAKWFVEQRGRAISIAALGFSLAGVIIAPLLTPFVDAHGWRPAWLLLAAVTLAVGYPASALMLRQPEDLGLHPDGRSDDDVRIGAAAAVVDDYRFSFTRNQALRTSAFYLTTTAFSLAMLSVATIVLQAQPFVTDSGYSREVAQWMVALLALVAMVTRLGWGLLIDRYGPRLPSAASFAIGTAGMVLMIEGGRSDSIAVLVAGFVLLGIAIGNAWPAQEVMWASYFGRRYLGAVRAAALPPQLLLSAAGPLVVNGYFDRVGDYNGVFLALAGLWLVAAALVLLARRPHHPDNLALS